MGFKDHFSTLAGDYARHRPRYPDALFAYLAKQSQINQSQSRSLAWDCATGSGQAATALAEHFTRVIATDASSNQLSEAVPHPRVEYRTATAEDSGLESASADICTVAQAVHWFDHEKFYAEVRRVVRPGGLVALWTYTESAITPAIDTAMRDFYRLIRPYFPPERRWVDERYETLPFSFPKISTPDFFMEASWNLDDVLGYYRSWSGVKGYEKQHGESPLPLAEEKLRAVWSNPEKPLPAKWKIHLLLGKVEAVS